MLSAEETRTVDHDLAHEFAHRFEELMNVADGIEFALRSMSQGDDKESKRTAALTLLGLIRSNFAHA